MSQLAAECGALNLAQGFPSFEPPERLLERIEHHLRNGANQYAPMAGVPALLEQIAAKTARYQGRPVDPATEITVSCGATEALFCAVQACVDRDDEVIVFDPAYDSYEPAVTLAGGRVRHVPLVIAANGHDFEIDWQRLADSIGPRTRLIILNFPHNPTGALLDAAALDRLASIVANHDILLLSDEVYEHIVFDSAEHHSLLRHDALWPRSLIVSSFGKTFHATGWKVGYCIAPSQLSAEFRKVHQYATFSINTPVQHAIAEFLAADDGFVAALGDFYAQKRDVFCQLLAGSGFRLRPARSTFFQILDYSAIDGVNELPDTELASHWTRDIGVASIPLSVFCEAPFTERRLRFCFAKDDATLAEAARRLCDRATRA